jgi:hypothetical protein
LLHREGFLVPISTWSWLVKSGGQDFILSVAEERHSQAEGATQTPGGRAARNRSGDPERSEAKNARRCDLIDRKIQNTISTKEPAELDDLQEALLYSSSLLRPAWPFVLSAARMQGAEEFSREEPNVARRGVGAAGGT